MYTEQSTFDISIQRIGKEKASSFLALLSYFNFIQQMVPMLQL